MSDLTVKVDDGLLNIRVGAIIMLGRKFWLYVNSWGKPEKEEFK